MSTSAILFRRRRQPAEAGLSPVGTVEFSRGREPTVDAYGDPHSRVAATELVVRLLCRRYAAIRREVRGFRGLAPTAKLCRRYAATSRRAFTLVELLVVIFIMLLITAITLPVIAPAVQNRDVREAARMMDVFINGARTRAKLNGSIYGIMIERMPGMPSGAVTLSYCEPPDPYTGDYAAGQSFPGAGGAAGSTIRMYRGAFAAWDTAAFSDQSAADYDPAFPMLDSGWIAGPAPSGTGWLTNIAPGDVITVQGQQYRIWAGEPFVDLDQSGFCNVTGGFSPNTPIGVQEPFADIDGNGTWTPPNPPPGQSGTGYNGVSVANTPGQPYVDPNSGYFVQPNASSINGPFPTMTWGTASAFITYWYFDPVQAAQSMNSTGLFTANVGPTPPPTTKYTLDLTQTPPKLVPVANGAASCPFSFQRRPIKTSAPSIQLPGQAVIDLGANYFYPGQPPNTPNIVAIPGSGIEVLVANANAYGWWSTFRANPTLDPTLPGTPASLPPGSKGYLPPDPTSIMITFQPSGTVDRVFSWSEANNTNGAMTYVNWGDWQGRIPAGPIYFLIGQQGLLNGDPDVVPNMANMAASSQPPLKPIYNVQDPTALWVVIDPRTGAVATAENVGYDLNSPLGLNAGFGTPFDQMSVYWAANVYYSRRLARDMLDIGGR